MKKALLFSILLLLIWAVPCWAANYYVWPGCNPSTECTATENGTTGWTNAWRSFANINWGTLQTAASSQPVYLYIKKGSTSAARLQVTGSGSSDTNRITITVDPTDTGADPIISNPGGHGVTFDEESYLTFSHINSSNNLYVGIGGGVGGVSTGVIIEDCTVNGNGTAGTGGQGIFFDGDDIIIRRNTIGNTNGVHNLTHGIYVNQTSAEIYDNVVYGSLQGNGIQVKCSTNVYRNLVYNNHHQGIHFGENTNNNIVINAWSNVVYGNKSGGGMDVSQKGTGTIDASFYNNSLYHNGADGGDHSTWNVELYIQENLTSLTIKNNIFYSGTNQYTIGSLVTQSNMIAENNIHYGHGDSTAPIYHNGAVTWANWTAAGYDSPVGYNADPLYVNPPTDMSLQSSPPSPGIDTGVDLGDTYKLGLGSTSSWPSSVITVDRDTYTPWDIGAFEYEGDTTSPVVVISTSDPSNISIDSLAISGTATDAVGVSSCKFRIGSAPDASNGTVISGTTSWSGTATGFAAGVNTLYVGCTDVAANWGSDSITVNYNRLIGTGITITGGTAK